MAKQLCDTKILIGGFFEEKETQKFFETLDDNKNKRFNKHIIAYIDFLGMKEKMKTDSYNSLQIIRYLLDKTQSAAKGISQTNGINDFNIKIFSDNVVIAQKIKPKKFSDQLISIVNLIWSLQFWALLEFGYMIRGGITFGDLYIDNNIVWDTGLVDAYNIENSLEIYPRVLISKTILKKYDRDKHKKLNVYALIKKDEDSLFFVDYMSATPNINSIPLISEVLKERFLLFKNIKDERVKAKINWTISYFNSHCLRFKDHRDSSKYVLEYIN